MRLKSPAKLNLILKVYPPRYDGYHEIWSIFQKIDICDTLTIEPIPEKKILLTCNNPDIPIHTNTIVKLYALLAPKLTTGFKIHLDKQIPTGAGLGGGSSNAGTFLSYLANTQSIDITPSLLNTIAVTIGADIPFFAGPSTALVTGIGNILKPIHLKIPPYIGVCYPNVHSDTKAAYAALDASRYPGFSVDPPTTEIESHFGENDFMDSVKDAIPIIAEILNHCQKSGQPTPSLSGSGSSLFWLFESLEQQKNWVTWMNDQWPKVTVWATRPLVNS